MAHKYVVYVATPGEMPSPEARYELGRRLKLPEDKLDALLRRLPAEVTKPVPEATAAAVANHFREAGLDASVRPADIAPPAPPTVSTGPGIDRPEEPVSAATGRANGGRRDGRRSGDEDWAGQFRPAKEGASAQEDGTLQEEELLPESAVRHDKQTKPPSAGLLIALVAVVAVLVALWLLL